MPSRGASAAARCGFRGVLLVLATLAGSPRAAAVASEVSATVRAVGEDGDSWSRNRASGFGSRVRLEATSVLYSSEDPAVASKTAWAWMWILPEGFPAGDFLLPGPTVGTHRFGSEAARGLLSAATEVRLLPLHEPGEASGSAQVVSYRGHTWALHAGASRNGDVCALRASVRLADASGERLRHVIFPPLEFEQGSSVLFDLREFGVEPGIRERLLLEVRCPPSATEHPLVTPHTRRTWRDRTFIEGDVRTQYRSVEFDFDD